MNKVALGQDKNEVQAKIQQESFAWTDNPHIQKLLDVVASIIADEYIQIAKQNKDIFELASVASLPRNDEREAISHNGAEQNGGQK